MSTAAQGALCALHPDVLATDVCTRCGGFACRACRRLDRELQPYCVSCYGRLDRRQSASTLAFVCAVLGFLGLGCSPLGAVAIVLGGADLAMIAAGRAPDGGRKLDGIGLALGVVGVLFGVVILLRRLNGSAG